MNLPPVTVRIDRVPVPQEGGTLIGLLLLGDEAFCCAGTLAGSIADESPEILAAWEALLERCRATTERLMPAASAKAKRMLAHENN